MDRKIQHDVQRMIAEIESVQVVLRMLEKDHALWARNREEKDLSEFMKSIKLLETCINTTMSTCISCGKNDKKKAITEIARSFGYLDAVFQDLKKARHDLELSYIPPEELKNLEIDWARFRKNISKSLNRLGAVTDHKNTATSTPF